MSGKSPGPIRVAKLPGDRWKEARALRLEALRTEPGAFGSSYEEEVGRPEQEWRKRMEGTLYALSGGKPVGMASRVFNDRVRTGHIAAIYGVYVTPAHRGRGVGSLLMERALSDVRKKRGVVKVQLSVNPEFRPALRLYKKFGFEVTGKARNELRVGKAFFDMLYMEKEIRKP